MTVKRTGIRRMSQKKLDALGGRAYSTIQAKRAERSDAPPKSSRPLKRGGRIARGKGVNPVNRKRKASEFKRCYHSKERVAFVKLLRCVASGRLGSLNDPIDNAHVARVGEKGMGYKGSYITVVPLRRSAHRLLHDDPTEFFRRYPHLDAATLAHAALDTEQLWQRHSGGAS